MDVIPNEDHIQLLASMGFTNDVEVRRALRLAKNDISEAVSLLTSEVPGLYDVEMTVPTSSTVENCQKSASNNDNVENMEVDESSESLEFPTTHLYELESRVFTSSWSIPYKKEESLGRCLIASVKLAKEGLAESDENCRRFLESCMPVCFEKLMTAYQVNRWGQEVQEGIYQMLQLFVDLICARLFTDPVPWRLLEVLSICLDPNTNYHSKNNRKTFDRLAFEAEFGNEPLFAENSSQFDESFGYLISLINRFAAKRGFDSLVKKFESPTLTAHEMFYILKPISFCVDFLNAPIAAPTLRPCIDATLASFTNLTDVDAKKGNSSSIIVDLLGHVKNLLTHLYRSTDEANAVDDLRLTFIYKLLKSSNFGMRMNALKEITKLLDMLTSPNKMDERLLISADKLCRWMSENEVLSSALEGNIDQAQYCDRLRNLLLFLGPRLSCQDVTKIWSLRRGRAAVTVDNVHTIVTQAATKFGAPELDHLLVLIQKSWTVESERSKEKLIAVLGKIGLDTSVAYTYEQVSALLWTFAHQQPKISINLVNLCLEEHLSVVTASGRDTLRADYITKCLNDIKEGAFVLPAMAQLHGLVDSIKKSGFNSVKSQKAVISDLVNKRQLVESLCDNLIRMHKLAVETWRTKNKTRDVVVVSAPCSGDSMQHAPTSNVVGSLSTVQSLSIQTSSNGPTSLLKTEPEIIEEFGPDFLLPNGFTYGYHVDAILDFLRFVLVAGELFLLIHRCQELWDTLIADENACTYGREAGFAWFLKGINDLEKNCQMQLFQDRMLKLDPTRYTSTGFACFRRYFESVNSNEQKIRLSTYGPHTIEVEKPDLIGLDYIWQMTLSCTNEEIAKEAIELLISLNFTYLSNRLKQKDPSGLHKKFLSECYRRLESAILTLKQTPIVEFLNRSAKILASVAVPSIFDAPAPEKHEKIRSIERLLLIAETYVKVVENAQQPGMIRTTPSHGSSFFSRCFALTINYEDSVSTPNVKKNDVMILVDENETLGMIRERLATLFRVDYARLTLEFDGHELTVNQDQQILAKLGIAAPRQECEKRILIAKRKFLATFVSSFDTVNKSSEIRSINSGTANVKSSAAGEQERNLPAVIMAQDRQVFDILYQLVNLEEVTVTTRVRELLLMIPSDTEVIEVLDNLSNTMSCSTAATATVSVASSSKSNSLDRKSTSSTASLISKATSESISEKLAALASASPKSKNKQQEKDKELQKEKEALEILKPLLDVTSPGLNPFRLLYNIEVLSSRLLPTSYLDPQTLSSATQFAAGFVKIGGVSLLISILKKDFLPPGTDPFLRHNIYQRVLQLLNYLLCDKSTLQMILQSQKDHILVSKKEESLKVGTTDSNPVDALASASSCAKSDYAISVEAMAQNAWMTLNAPSSGSAVNELYGETFTNVLDTLQRLSWAAAGGLLHLIGSDLKSPPSAVAANSASAWFLGSPRSRTSESSTGSSDSETPTNLHSGVASCQTSMTAADVDIAKQSLRLLIDCALIRANDLQAFFNLPHLSDYVLDLLLVTESEDVRSAAEKEFSRISELTTPLCYFYASTVQSANNSQGSYLRRAVLRSQSHHSPQSSISSSAEAHSARYLLFTILLKAPLPLWTTSSNVRGSTQRLLAQCGEYFSFRGRLLSRLTSAELATLQPTPTQMLEDEAHWILGFSCSHIPLLVNADNVLLTGHLELITVLVRLLPDFKLKFGQLLICPLLDEFLFPSVKLFNRTRKDESSLRRVKAADVRAKYCKESWHKCQKHECRLAAYELLLELCRNCFDNFQSLTQNLISMHHQPANELNNEWDYSPLIEAKMDNGFVGLKNAGATCYMNAVLQQFYMEQGLADTVLSAEVDDNDESIRLFRELQRLFGHLKESEQQYYVPKTFWDVFKLFGQQVNPREQQDAFEFFSCLIDQIDEILKKNGREELFRQKYQGIFSDQKICQGCPHRYEREEAFYALNLPVRAHNLEESLNNFVKGEILEGDNAYFCEKCGQKRTALKRMCIKTLPPVMVIQLKRFSYDWEENRALKFNDAFQFPLQLDLFPYTSNALAQLEGGEDWELGTSPLVGSGQFLQFLNSPSGSNPISSAAATPTGGRPRRHTSRLSLLGMSEAVRYELVGVVVHSGQANAGHYYAYIKDRRDDAVINGSFNRWFKFNDTTVESVEMTEHFMETELFGGKYTAKSEKNSVYPEERERYWNAYLLFYRRLGGTAAEGRTPRLTSKRSVSMSCSNTPQNKNPRRRDSLMELAELVEQGEQLQLFCNDVGPPSWLRMEIQEENFKFARNRDVFNVDYFTFVRRLLDLGVDSERFALVCMDFALAFLLNTAWHCKKSMRGDPQPWADVLIDLNHRYAEVCRRLVDYFVERPEIIKEYLLDCSSSDVRQCFSTLIAKVLFEAVHEDRARCASLLERLLALVGKEAVERSQNSTSLFHILHRITCLSSESSKILLEKQAFSTLLNFMLQVSTTGETSSAISTVSRRWPVHQAREFSDVYLTLAGLIVQCDLSKFWTTSEDDPTRYVPKNIFLDMADVKFPPVTDMMLIVGGRLMPGFIKELVWAASNVYNCAHVLSELMLYLIWKNEKIGRRLIVEILLIVANQPSNELKPLFATLEQVLLLNGDGLTQQRVDLVLEGCKETSDRVEGLLNIVKSSQLSDSRRSYVCVKFLAKTSEKSVDLKTALNKRLEMWQWAVAWLKNRMEDEVAAGGDGNHPGGAESPDTGILPGPVQAPSSTSKQLSVPSSHASNDDSTTRHFQRTVSAQYTLDQAKALLSEFETVEPANDDPECSSPPLTMTNVPRVVEISAEKVVEDEDVSMKTPPPPVLTTPIATTSQEGSDKTKTKKESKKNEPTSIFYVNSSQ